MTEVWLAFLTGLTGSFHCLGMCGGIVAAIAHSARDSSPGARRMTLLAYNLGRITTYTLLGAVAGLLGSSLDRFLLRTVANWFFVAANLFVLLVGLASVVQLSSFSIFSLDYAGGRVFSGVLRWAVSEFGFFRTYILGMALGLLPCGLIFAPLPAAIASSNFLIGGAIMGALGLGTLPVLFSFGTASAAISARLQGKLFRLVGLFVALIGCAGLWRVLGKMGYVAPFPWW